MKPKYKKIYINKIKWLKNKQNKIIINKTEMIEIYTKQTERPPPSLPPKSKHKNN